MTPEQAALISKALDLLRGALAPVATLLAGYIGVRYGLKQIKIQREMDFVDRQLRMFYSPLLGHLYEIRAKSALRLRISKAADDAWRELVERSPQPFEGHEKAYEPFGRIINYDNQQLRNELLPTYKKMLEIFRDNYYLAEPETAKWYSELSDFVELWDRWLSESIPADVIKKLDHGESALKPFYEELEKRHEQLRKRLSSETRRRSS